MKNDLTCEVVQDLLPSYVDHLTSDVTNTAIETHIRECADCRRILSDMQTPEPVPAQTATDASTIDFLKKSNKRNKRRILAAILIVTRKRFLYELLSYILLRIEKDEFYNLLLI